MKLCMYCLFVLICLSFAGCSTATPLTAEQDCSAEYEALRRNSSLPDPCTLSDCIRRTDAGTSWETAQIVVDNYFAIAVAVFLEKFYLKSLADAAPPAHKRILQVGIAEQIKRRNQASAALCRAMNIYPGTQINVDFQLPEKLPPLALPRLEVLEKAVLLSPLCRQYSTVEILAIFHRTYTAMLAEREKFLVVFKNFSDKEVIPVYAGYLKELNLLCLLTGVESFDSANIKKLNEKIFIFDQHKNNQMEKK